MIITAALVALAVATITLAFLYRRARRQLGRLPQLAERLQSLDNVCLTELGRGLDAMRAQDFGVRVQPATTPLEEGGAGTVGDLERTFNRMLARAQGGLGAYNDVAGALEATMERMGQVSDMLEALRTNCLSDLAQALEAMGGGDLTRRVQPTTSPVDVEEADVRVVARLVATANGMLGHVQAGVETYNAVAGSQEVLISRLVELAGVLTAASADLATSAREVGNGTEEVARSAGELASGATAQVQMLAVATTAADAADESARRADHVSREGVASAERASEAMVELRGSSEAVAAAMADLSDKSSRIGTIVEAITGIADQTNLLALNAAIEAARAGDHGRGFAVVADEVRKLAEESQLAARDIGGILEQIREETDSAVGLVDASARNAVEGAEHVESARGLFERISTAVGEVNDRVSQITSSASDVSAVAAQSSSATEQVAAATQETMASMQEVTDASQGLAALAGELAQLTGRFVVGADVRSPLRAAA